MYFDFFHSYPPSKWSSGTSLYEYLLLIGSRRIATTIVVIVVGVIYLKKSEERHKSKHAQGKTGERGASLRKGIPRP